MSSETLKKFANELKAAREKEGLTLLEVHDKTRIDRKILTAIEEGNFEILPEVYIRAFIKEYGASVGLDPKMVIKNYDLAKSGEIKDLNAIEEDSDVKEEQKEVKKEFDSETYTATTKSDPGFQLSKNAVIGISTVGLVVIVLIVYFVFIQKSEPVFITENPIEEAIEENQNQSRFETKNKEPVAVTGVDSLNLTVSAKDTSWVRVLIDNSKSEEFILYPGRRKELKGTDSFNILLGNAGGVELFLNGNNLNYQGRVGRVRNVVVDKNGLRQLTPQPIKSDE
ncbi:MAG: helix-turn-helix domain-containing protein [Ignavibacteria bacterium]|jgi:cytoskeletal protein RodZ